MAKELRRLESIVSIAVIAAFMLAQIPFSLAEWVAVGDAPGDTGIYDVIIQATYNGVTGTFPLQLEVGGDLPYETGNLTVEPVYPISRAPPINLRYDIRLNGTYDFSMVESNLSVYYVSGDTLLKSDETELQFNEEGYWAATVDVPLKGEYRAVIALLVEKDGQRYGGQFVAYFESDTPSQELLLSHDISTRILTPAESFEVTLEATFGDAPLPGLEIFKAGLYGTIKDFGWDEGEQKYDVSLTAPTTEGIYMLSIYAEGQDFVSQDKIYIAEISKPKSGTCPITSNRTCSDMKDVRKCIYDYKSDIIVVTEDALMQCFEDGTGAIIYGSIICEGQYKGDLDGDQQLDADDLEIMQNLILPLSQSQRQEYKKCADYDNDDDVDEQDLECLSNVVSDKWHGDFHGGICFDAEYESPLKCDLTGDKFIQDDDMQLMNELIYAAQQDISMPDYVLKTCDFNQDGRITVEDSLCMQYFNGMELGNPATLLAAGQTIPSSCMNVYTLDQCQGIPGDINGDLKIDELDEILIMLVEAEQITGDDESCSDVNEELGVTIEDVECVKSYVNGNREYYFICIGCSDITPAAYRAEYEICNDGFDNDCNGLTDRTSMNPADDWCMCNANTPCWMVWDSDGGVVPGISDGNVKVCRKNNWDENTNATAGAASGYRWSSPMEFLCDENKECETTECKDTLWKCMYDSTNGFTWIDSPSKAPKEDDDPMGSPKTCEDGYDNDCLCGDMKCKEIEAGNMFSSWQFWVGFVLGAVLAIFCPPCSVALFYLSLAASAATIFFGEELGPEWSAALSGFSMGVSVGTIVKSAATAMTKTAATKAGEEAGKSAAGEATKTATKEAAEKGLTEEATKEYVKKAAEDAAKKAAEEAYKKAAEEAAKEAGKDLASESTKSTIKTGATEAGKAAVAEAGHVAASATLMGAVKDLFASLVSSNPFQSQIWSMVAFGAASMGMQKAAIEYANSTAEWKAVKQTCTENA